MRHRLRHTYLFISVLALFVGAPFLRFTGWSPHILSGLFALVLAAGVYAASRIHRQFILVAALGAINVLAESWHIATGTTESIYATLGVGAIFLIVVSLMIFREFFRAKRVTVDLIFGVIGLYFLIGISWAYFFALIETAFPGSYAFGSGELLDTSQRGEILAPFVYFSFVSLTTLGYGDLLPQTDLSRMLAALEGVMGQMYLAIVVARFVALHITHSNAHRARKEKAQRESTHKEKAHSLD